jgi:hypothetical protein
MSFAEVWYPALKSFHVCFWSRKIISERLKWGRERKGCFWNNEVEKLPFGSVGQASCNEISSSLRLGPQLTVYFRRRVVAGKQRTVEITDGPLLDQVMEPMTPSIR